MDFSSIVAGGTAQWSRIPKAKLRTYQLKQGDDVVGSLQWQKGWGSLVLGETRAGSWSFKRVGFFTTKVSVRVPGSEQEIAAFYPSLMSGGRVEFSDGRAWGLHTQGLFNQQYELTNSSGQPELTLRPTRKGAVVIFGETARDERTIGLLSLLLWHVTLLANEDATSTAVLVAAIS